MDRKLVLDGIEISSEFEIPTDVKILHVNKCSLTELPKLPEGLIELYCSHNEISTLPALPKTLKKLVMRNNRKLGFMTPESLPDGLEYLDLSYNELFQLPPNIPNGVKHLDISYNQITYIDKLPSKLISFICNNNNLYKLPDIPECLEEIDCRNNNIIKFPKFRRDINVYSVGQSALYTQISKGSYKSIINKYMMNGYDLDTLKEILIDEMGELETLSQRMVIDGILVLSNLKLRTDVKISDDVKFLYLNNCSLGYLPKLPEGLIELYCSDNKLNSLPVLPKSLKKLVCSHNHIYKLPQLPEGLIEIDCSHNYILDLPEFPESVKVSSSGQTGIREQISMRISRFDTSDRTENLTNDLIQEYKHHGYDLVTIRESMRRKRTY